VRQHFGVRLGKEAVPVAQEFVPQAGVVLDDAIVDQGQVARLIRMGVRIGVAGQAVRRPAGVADAKASLGRFPFHQFRQAGDAADALADLKPASDSVQRPAESYPGIRAGASPR